ncbi:MAG: alpha/beta hydrolase domain-containing protein [Acidimicrobiales bacterium]
MTRHLRRLTLLLVVALAAAVLPAVSLSTTSAGAASTIAAPPLPWLTLIPANAGTHGYAYDAVPQAPLVADAPYFPLSTLGYVENEYLMSGTTNIYQQSGSWSSNGDWNVSVAQSNVPYTTNMLVRYPTDPSKFNGTVVLEWSNTVTGGDQDPVWSELDNELLTNGYAYMLVTPQNAGMSELKAWDSVRYGALGDTNDGQSYDIYTEAAEAARYETGVLFPGLTVKNVIGVGDSLSAFRVDTYVNAFQPLFHAFNAFMAAGRSALTAPLTGNGIFGTTFPVDIRTDNTAPFIQVNSQGDILELDAAAARQPDNTDLRTWEVAGAAHIDIHETEYELETIGRDNPTLSPPSCIFGTPVSGGPAVLNGLNQTNNMSWFEVEDAAIADIQNWLVNGVPAPHASQLSATPLFFGLFFIPATNQYGLSSGGIQMPEAQVPTEDYGQINFSTVSAETFDPVTLIGELAGIFSALDSGEISNPALRSAGLCMLNGYFTNLSSSTLKSLYPTLGSYVAKYTAAANAEVAAGFLTRQDATAAIANAAAGYGPTQTPAETIP